MNRTMRLQERRMEKSYDVLGRFEAKRLSALDAAELLGCRSAASGATGAATRRKVCKVCSTAASARRLRAGSLWIGSSGCCIRTARVMRGCPAPLRSAGHPAWPANPQCTNIRLGPVDGGRSTWSSLRASAPRPARIDDRFILQSASVDVAKLPVVGQKHHDLGRHQCLVQ